MAQCLVTFAVISPIEPSLPITVDGIMDPGLPPHTPYLGTPVVFPPGQRPVSFFAGDHFCKFMISFATAAKITFVCSKAKLMFLFEEQ